MLTSITPLGERGRASRWRTTVAAYLVGSVAGGLVLGGAAGAVGAALPLEHPAVAAAGLALLAAVGVWGVLVELGRLPRLGSPARQVDEDWLHRYRGWVYGVGYGFQLGLGVVTIIPSATFHVTAVLAVLTGSPSAGALVGAVFGLARALPVLALRSVHTAAALTAAARRVEALAPVARGTAAAALAAVTAAAGAGLVLAGTGGA